MLKLQDMEIAVVCGPDRRTWWLRVLGYSRKNPEDESRDITQTCM